MGMPKKYPQRKRVKRFDPFGPENVMTNPSGPLATMNLKKLLVEPEAFDLLSADSRRYLLSMLPEEHIETDATGQQRIKQSFLKSEVFSYNVALFQEDVREGRTDPEWLRQAHVASKNRRAGKFDAFLAKEAKENWGLDLKALHEAKRKAEMEGKRALDDEGEDKEDDEEAETLPSKKQKMLTSERKNEPRISSSPLSSPPPF